MGHAVTLQQGGIAFHVHEVVEDAAHIVEASDVFQLVHVGLQLPLGGLDGILFLLLGIQIGVLFPDVGNLLLIVTGKPQFLCHLLVECGELHFELVVADDLFCSGGLREFFQPVLDSGLEQVSLLFVVLGIDEGNVGIGALGFTQFSLSLLLELLKFQPVLFLAALLDGCKAVGQVGLDALLLVVVLGLCNGMIHCRQELGTCQALLLALTLDGVDFLHPVQLELDHLLLVVVLFLLEFGLKQCLFGLEVLLAPLLGGSFSLFSCFLGSRVFGLGRIGY